MLQWWDSTNFMEGGSSDEDALTRSASYSKPTNYTEALESLAKREQAVRQQALQISDLMAYVKTEVPREFEVRKMKEVFSTFDLDNDNKLSSKEFIDFLVKLGTPLQAEDKEEALKTLFQGDTHGHVSFDEFLDWWDSQQEKLEDSEARIKRFKLITDSFSEPYEQQKLIVEEEGTKFTTEYRIHFKFQSAVSGAVREVSPWHDIPLFVRDAILIEDGLAPPGVSAAAHAEGINKFHFVCEIPKWTRAKFEVATNEEHNPIKQDVKNGVPRFYKHGDMQFNYGMFPQTWEDPHHKFVEAGGIKGDNDPIDVIEIGTVQLQTGAVRQVKVLGVLGMVDAGEMDWKVIAIQTTDQMAHFLWDIDDVPKHMPGALETLREWLRVYKVCSGGTPSEFAFDAEYKDKAFALKVIKEAHLHWKQLVTARQQRTV
eukprot:TRINITY_DN113210_c0_g1_i1.p1 TRINITY_DN113210_c0_g1~~TRINITY_DN113210_c0_g1_i1.p1  ORF type:complete len:447 (+),score=68.25 TRINITY_DN113210_c0_g1_i1:58-1341(+)